jgi:hypothetical protein
MRCPVNKIPPFTKEEVAFIKRNWKKMTNRQLAEHFHMGYTTFNHRKVRLLGLKHMEMEKWTEEQVTFLLKWYRKRGDLELAEMFNERWYKKKGWTLKHIEKKRMYLGIKRTPEELRAIKERHKKHGVYIRASKKTWATRGVKPEGTVVYWARANQRPMPFVKVKGRFILWTRWYWRKYRGHIPTRMKVTFKDGNPYNRRISNLELITAGELSKRNSKVSSQGLSDNYVVGILTHGHPELRSELRKYPIVIEMKRQSLILNRTINGIQQKAS